MQRLRWPVMIGVVLLAVLIGLVVYLAGGRYESTDDAEIGGARVSISSSVSGRVVEIDVRDNQLVRAGQVLFRLDPQPFQTAFDEAQAGVAASRLQVEQMRATYRQRQADIKTAEASLAYLVTDARRQAALVRAGTATQAQVDQAASQVDQARQRLSAAREAASAALASLGGDANIAADNHPLVRQAQARLASAALNQSYLTIIAPQDGIVTKVDQLQVGDYINTAVPVFSLVSSQLWIDANFKENQLEYMRAGQSAKVKLDAYPDRRFDATVQALTPGTGSSFSLLPAENATGNWVKVTQRVPVRIVFAHDPGVPLEPGLSATVTVDTTHRRKLFGPQSASAAPSQDAETPLRGAASAPPPPPASAPPPQSSSPASPAASLSESPPGSPARLPSALADNGASVQVGAFASKSSARRICREAVRLLRGQVGAKTTQIEATRKDGETLFRAYIRGFESRGAAADYCMALRAKGRSCVVT